MCMGIGAPNVALSANAIPVRTFIFSAASAVFDLTINIARATMLPRLQKLDSLSSGDFSKHQRAEHRDGVRRRAVKVSGGFARGVKA